MKPELKLFIDKVKNIRMKAGANELTSGIKQEIDQVVEDVTKAVAINKNKKDYAIALGTIMGVTKLNKYSIDEVIGRTCRQAFLETTM